MPTPRTATRTGRPPRLTRSDVVAAARRIGTRHGIEGLTMRALADALGVLPNSIYTYFPDKVAILDAVLDDLLGDVERLPPRASWRRGLVTLMGSYRRLLLTQPGLISLTVSRQMLGPNALRLRESMLALLISGGLDGGEAVNGYLALFAYTTGFVAFEVARRPGERDEKQRAHARGLYTALAREDFPRTTALARQLATRPGDREFKRGLEAVIAGFGAEAAN